MKFKILKGTETFKKLDDFEKEIKRVNKCAIDLSKELGGDEKGTHLGHPHHLAGGIFGIKMPDKPDGWKDASKNHYNFFFPKINKANKPILDKINSLPILKHKDLNDILSFEFQSSGFTWYNCPGVEWGKEYILLNVDDNCYFTPNEDMIEILGSEYIKLKDNVKNS